MLFRLHVYQFTFEARAALFFPRGKAGNVFRGALGSCFRQSVCDPSCPGPAECAIADCPYQRLFTPRMPEGPSGLADAPRPFVLRAAHLDGLRVPPGTRFTLGVHIFDLASPVVQYFALAFTRLIEDGLGPGRGSVELSRIEAGSEVLFEDGRFIRHDHPEALTLDLNTQEPVERVRLTFLTPTEIKSAGEILPQPEFEALFARLRDRIANLRALYGESPLEIDFRGLQERAAGVQLVRAELEQHHVDRFSTRTQQQHPLGGFTGVIEYAGPLGEFMPYLRAGEYTGVGRQTVWGKGAYRAEVLADG